MSGWFICFAEVAIKAKCNYSRRGERGFCLKPRPAWDAVPRKILLVGGHLNPRSEIGDHHTNVWVLTSRVRLIYERDVCDSRFTFCGVPHLAYINCVVAQRGKKKLWAWKYGTTSFFFCDLDDMIAHPINSLFFFLSWSVPTEIMIDEADSPIIPLHDLHVRISATDSDATGAGDFRITICTKVCVHYSTNLSPPRILRHGR